MYSQEVQPTVPTRVDFSRPLKYDSYPCRLQSTAGKEHQNRESRVRIPSGQGVSCLKTSFTVFSRTDYELELSSSSARARSPPGRESAGRIRKCARDLISCGESPSPRC